MFWQTLTTVFFTVFLAEMGDKTQLATMMYSADGDKSRLAIFVGAASALVLTSAIGVLAGSIISNYVPENIIKWAAGIGFIAVGIWTIFSA